MSNGRIYFIGGASGSGKSVAAGALAKKLNLPLVRLDEYHNMILNTEVKDSAAKELTRKICTEIVQNLVDTGAQCIIEGGWITVEQAAQWQANATFLPVFCGFPNTTAKDRLDLIYQRKRQSNAHWLNDKTEEKALSWLERQIKDSCCYKQSCTSTNVKFIDFSSAQTGCNELTCHFQKLHLQ